MCVTVLSWQIGAGPAHLASEAAAVDAHAGGSVLRQRHQQLRDPFVAFIYTVVAAADQQCVEQSGLCRRRQLAAADLPCMLVAGSAVCSVSSKLLLHVGIAQAFQGATDIAAWAACGSRRTW